MSTLKEKLDVLEILKNNQHIDQYEFDGLRRLAMELPATDAYFNQLNVENVLDGLTEYAGLLKDGLINEIEFINLKQSLGLSSKEEVIVDVNTEKQTTMDKIAELKTLLEDGIISEQEYSKMKKDFLGINENASLVELKSMLDEELILQHEYERLKRVKLGLPVSNDLEQKQEATDQTRDNEASKLHELNQLLSDGVIDNDDFSKLKRQILGL